MGTGDVNKSGPIKVGTEEACGVLFTSGTALVLHAHQHVLKIKISHLQRKQNKLARLRCKMVWYKYSPTKKLSSGRNYPHQNFFFKSALKHWFHFGAILNISFS